MADTLAALGNRFRFNTTFLRGLTKGFEPEQWGRTLSDAGGNSAHWILGHIASSRRLAVRLLGGDAAIAPWEAHFARGEEPGDAHDYPEPDVLARDFQTVGKQLVSILKEMGPEKQGQPWEGEPFPDGSDTLGGAAHFFHFHESYHLGQFGVLRRAFGLERVI